MHMVCLAADIIKANIAKKVRDIYSESSPQKLSAVPSMMLQYATPWGYSETSPNKRELKLLEQLTNLIAVPGAANVLFGLN